MKKMFAMIAFSLFMLIGASNVSAASTENFIIKVELKNNLGPSNTYKFTPKGQSVLKEDANIVFTKDRTYTLSIVNSKIRIMDGNQVIKDGLSTVSIIPETYTKENFVLLNNTKNTTNRPHMGTIEFQLKMESNLLQLQPVNHIGFEDYLKGVVPGEMYASWGVSGGMEALKTQAVAARSYVFALMNGDANKVINDTTFYQVYAGFIWDPISPSWDSYYKYSTQAVDETKGEIMTYTKSNGTKGFVEGLYSSSNGGQTELPQQYWSNSLPYIKSSKVDTFDTVKWPTALIFKKQQLASLDYTTPEKWWSTTNEQNLDIKLVNANSQKAFTSLKNRMLSDLKKVDPTISSIKIESINSVGTQKYDNTGKVKQFNLNVNYLEEKEDVNGDSIYTMELGTQSKTLAGVDRFETSVEIAKEGWKTKPQTVVIGRGDIPVDALAGTVLASKNDAPMLLTRTNALPEIVTNYLKTSVTAGAKVYILGGTGAISTEVENQIKALGFQVKRLEGISRTETSIAIAEEIGKSNKVFFATGNSESSDALSISAYAARNGNPIIIQNGAKVITSTFNYLNKYGVGQVDLIGGTYAVPQEVATELTSKGYKVDRVAGTGRVETSIAINKKYPMGTDTLVIGNAYNFVDALSGAVLSAKNNASILLLNSSLEVAHKDYLKTITRPKTVNYLGGNYVVSKELKYELAPYVGGKLQSQKYTLSLTGSQLRSVLGSSVLKSTDFDTYISTGQFELNGTGYGHGIGMSQNGAYARSKVGHKYDAILEFYYDGIKIEQAMNNTK